MNQQIPTQPREWITLESVLERGRAEGRKEAMREGRREGKRSGQRLGRRDGRRESLLRVAQTLLSSDAATELSAIRDVDELERELFRRLRPSE